MIELEPRQPNSRRGYPIRDGNTLKLFDEPQFNGHAFLPGYTITNIDHLNEPIPLRVRGEDIPIYRNLEFGVIKRNGAWLMHHTFAGLAEDYAVLLSACESSPHARGLEAYNASLGQNQSSDGGAPALKAGVWHFDYPWQDGVGWFTAVSNVDVTEIALEEHRFEHGINVGAVSERAIWCAEPGEVVLLDTHTAHRRPRCYKRRVPRVLLNLEPRYTRRGTPRKACASMLSKVEMDEFSDVSISDVVSTNL
jgi:hypothetical protein